MADRDEGIEFIPTDDIVEAEAASAEEEAVHVEDADQPKERMSVEAEDFEAETLNEAEAEEREFDADEAAEAVEAGAREDHEEDLEEVVRRHYGIVEEQPDDELARDEREGVRDLGPGEFICRSCFMRRSASQQAEPGNGVCTDCAADGPT